MFNPIEVDEKWETLPLFPYLIGTMTKKKELIEVVRVRSRRVSCNLFVADASRRNKVGNAKGAPAIVKLFELVF